MNSEKAQLGRLKTKLYKLVIVQLDVLCISTIFKHYYQHENSQNIYHFSICTKIFWFNCQYEVHFEELEK